MTNTSIVSFNANANAIAISNPKQGMTGARLMTAAEWKKANGLGLTARQKSNGYNAYLRESGKANTAELAAAMTSGRLLVTAHKAWNKSGKRQVTFIDADKLKDKVEAEVKVDTAAAEKAATDKTVAAAVAILEKTGMAPEAIEAFKAMMAPQVAASAATVNV